MLNSVLKGLGSSTMSTVAVYLWLPYMFIWLALGTGPLLAVIIITFAVALLHYSNIRLLPGLVLTTALGLGAYFLAAMLAV